MLYYRTEAEPRDTDLHDTESVSAHLWDQAYSAQKPNQSLADVKDAGISAHMLGLIKSHASLLTMTSAEVTNPTVRRVLASQVQNFIEMAYEIFLYQNRNAYYQVPQLGTADMQKMLNTFVPAQGMPQMPPNNRATIH